AGTGRVRTVRASGSFEVKLTPQSSDAGAGLGRMSLEKVFHGDIEATSRGEMLTAGSSKSSGAYVAVEPVTGTMLGRRGTFALVHRGVMTDGKPDLSISVVPGSGTEGLAGLEGTLQIRIEPDGRHFYTLEGTLPGP